MAALALGHTCTKCRVTKPYDAFNTDCRSPTKRLQSWCKACTNEARARKYEATYQAVAAYKIEMGCIDCGYRTHAAALQFDHRPGEEKLYNVSQMMSRPMAVIWSEIDKCDVRCANCHAVKTAERREVTDDEQPKR